MFSVLLQRKIQQCSPHICGSPSHRRSSNKMTSLINEPDLKLVFFDTETTSLMKPDILQLAAVDFSGQKIFQSLIMPRMKCIPGSVKIHGYRKRDDGKMYYRGDNN